MSKSFDHWEREALEDVFGLQYVKNHAILMEWMNADESISASEFAELEELRVELEDEISGWNEEEVKLFFINNLIRMIRFKNSNIYKTFAQRTLSANVPDIQGQLVELRGRVEMVVSAGRQKPRNPFFCIHEYKPLRPSSANDPEGQLLSAMLATQALNVGTHTLYGVYVQGKFWNFMILQGKTYSISATYDATLPDRLKKIVSILKRCKYYIEKEMGLVQ
jgi:hypothetical protein